MDCLFLPADCPARLAEATPVCWLPAEGPARQVHLAEVAAAAPAALSLVVPIECCSAFAVALPTRKARWLAQALAYAAEELLAESVDELHLSLGEVLEDGRYRVIAIRRQLLAGWLEDLRAQGLSVVAIHVDADLLPREATQLLLIGERGLLGGSPEPRLAFAATQWPLLAEGCPAPRHAHGDAAAAPPLVDDYQPLEEPYRLLATHRAAAVNLAQGEFAVELGGSGLSYWKPLLATLGLILVVQLGFNLAQGWYFDRQAEAYGEASLALYRELFPQDTRIVDLRAQFTDHLSRGAGGQAGFLRLLEHVANALAEGTPVTVSQVDYNEDRGDLALQVQAGDFAALEQLRQQLAQAGQAVQLGSASRDGAGVSARVVIGGGA
ncbi:type II secretion system protein GspL [Pseudomonas oligotrophica]|uniref:type II secretion system protein GspL n=1 Tax=Pseudomonas oligotrophica TaxID=2912055 RepID=UPI001F007014|nr:type II secretion system protein GspL [Pseudomonas oligotrophica]MCF7200855.1 type II secretion system protein GspL [Pseudomonas oligotrophica]